MQYCLKNYVSTIPISMLITFANYDIIKTKRYQTEVILPSSLFPSQGFPSQKQSALPVSSAFF
jgi:hypothetical protein